jgi:hypothetical protein
MNFVSGLADMVDSLGTVKAEIAALQAKEKELVDKLKLTGLKEIDGTLFRATVCSTNRETVDTKSLRADLGENIIAPYLRNQLVTICRVNARKTS